MKRFSIALLCAGALITGACDDSGQDPILAPVVPLAVTRFVAAVSDTGGTDWRFVDQMEDSPTTIGLTFRNFTPYQPTAPGARHLRIFTSYPTDFFAANPNVAALSTPQVDTTITFTVDAHYSLVYVGQARAAGSPKAKLLVLQDNFTDPGANVALRVVNLNPVGNIDVFASATTTCPGTLPAASFTSVAYGTASASYIARPPGAFILCMTVTGSTTVLASVVAPPGAAGDQLNNLTPIGGSTMAGSVMTAYILPRAVAGSLAGTSTTPTIIYVIDKHPPRGF